MTEPKPESFVCLDRLLLEPMSGDGQTRSKLERAPSTSAEMAMMRVVVGCRYGSTDPKAFDIRPGDVVLVEGGIVADGNKRQFLGRSVYLCPIGHVIAHSRQWS